MPYADNHGVKIHYEVEGAGPPLLLQHGFTSSLESWYRNGYVEALRGQYRLILVDARGHGASDKPHDLAAYTYELRASDDVAVLDALDVPRAHFFGYSMGGRIGFVLAQNALQRFTSFIIGGSGPFARVPGSNVNRYVVPFQQGMSSYVAQREQQEGPMPDWQKTMILANDPQALIAAALASEKDPGREGTLGSLSVPCLLFAGDADAGAYEDAKRAAALIPNATFVSFPGLNHGQTNRRSDLVLPHVEAFLARASQATVSHD